MAETTTARLRGLVLTAAELRQLTDWPGPLIEDYLDIISNLILLAEELDTKSNILKNTTTVTDSVYALLPTDEVIFFDTDVGPITATLPDGIDGTNYRLINVGSSGNNVTIVPFGTDKLFGENETEYLEDCDVVIITFDDIEGWY